MHPRLHIHRCRDDYRVDVDACIHVPGDLDASCAVQKTLSVFEFQAKQVWVSLDTDHCKLELRCKALKTCATESVMVQGVERMVNMKANNWKRR